MVDVGDLVAPGRPLVRLESLSGRQIWLTVREADIHRVEEGQSIKVRFDSLQGQEPVQGTIDEIVPAADPTTHTFTIKVGLEDVEVASGTSGRGYLPGDQVERLKIPVSAVHQRGGLELVVIRAADGLARTRAVTLGRKLDEESVEVLSGLVEGDQVLIDISGPLAEGTPVEVNR